MQRPVPGPVPGGRIQVRSRSKPSSWYRLLFLLTISLMMAVMSGSRGPLRDSAQGPANGEARGREAPAAGRRPPGGPGRGACCAGGSVPGGPASPRGGGSRRRRLLPPPPPPAAAAPRGAGAAAAAAEQRGSGAGPSP